MTELRSRLSKIINMQSEALLSVVQAREPDSREATLSAQDMILRFSQADPTLGKSRTQWIVKTYLHDERFKLEDLGRVTAALSAFERFKRKLPIARRELSKQHSLRDLETLVEPLVQAEEHARLLRDLSSATGREKRRVEALKAREESIILQEGEGLTTLAVPMTEFASQWWGRGTRWCTAAENNNMFWEYHKQAPMVIAVCPDGAKFQVHVTKDDVQFMNASDEEITEELMETRWQDLSSLLLWVLDQDNSAFLWIPEGRITPELCHGIIARDGLKLRFIAPQYVTLALCKTAVEQNGLALDDVPHHKKTDTICRLAVEQNGLALEFVPEKQKITELCRIAVEQNGQALEYVPHHIRTKQLCYKAIEQNGLALYAVPDQYLTYEWYLSAVRTMGSAVQWVPTEHESEELYRVAIEQGGLPLDAVPENYLSHDFYTMAVQVNGLFLKDIPPEDIDATLCSLAVEQNVRALEYVPEHFRKEDLCHLAVEQYGLALHWVPEDQRTEKLCYIAVHKDGKALRFVPEKYKTEDLCRIAVKQNRLALRWVPKTLKTHEFLACVRPQQPNWTLDILNGLQKSEVTIPALSKSC
jgi:hypothetical protein